MAEESARVSAAENPLQQLAAEIVDDEKFEYATSEKKRTRAALAQEFMAHAKESGGKPSPFLEFVFSAWMKAGFGNVENFLVKSRDLCGVAFIKNPVKFVESSDHAGKILALDSLQDLVFNTLLTLSTLYAYTLCSLNKSNCKVCGKWKRMGKNLAQPEIEPCQVMNALREKVEKGGFTDLAEILFTNDLHIRSRYEDLTDTGVKTKVDEIKKIIAEEADGALQAVAREALGEVFKENVLYVLASLSVERKELPGYLKEANGSASELWGRTFSPPRFDLYNLCWGYEGSVGELKSQILDQIAAREPMPESDSLRVLKESPSRARARKQREEENRRLGEFMNRKSFI
jgi:hypothetical protein